MDKTRERIRSVHIPLDLHRQVRQVAAARDVSIKSLVIDAIKASIGGIAPIAPSDLNADGLRPYIPAK